MSRESSSSALPAAAAPRARAARRQDPVAESRLTRWLLTGIALLFLAGFLVVPLAAVFLREALAKGIGFYFESLADPDALVGDQADPDHGGRHRGAAEPGVRRRRRLVRSPSSSSAARAS